jgi:hypothetical protein
MKGIGGWRCQKNRIAPLPTDRLRKDLYERSNRNIIAISVTVKTAMVRRLRARFRGPAGLLIRPPKPAPR